MSDDAMRRPTFTLASLFVAVGVIGGLLGLALPKIRQAQEAARRNQCASNLKQLVLACHAFHDANRSLPAARLSEEHYDSGAVLVASSDIRLRSGLGPNWAVLILPYCEETGPPDQFNVSLGGEKAQPDAAPQGNIRDCMWDPNSRLPNGVLARSAKYPVHRCPSDRGDGAPFNGLGGSWGRGNYAINSGPCELIVGKKPSPCELGGPPFGNGVALGVAEVNWGAGLNWLTVRDGTANTILLAEIRIGLVPEDIRGTWALGYPGASILANASMSILAPNDNLPDTDIVTGCAASERIAGSRQQLAKMRMGCDSSSDQSSKANSRSNHPGGVNTAFCDGAVHFIDDSIAPRMWFRYLSAIDGELISMCCDDD